MSDQNVNVHLSVTSDAKGAEQHADALKKATAAQTQSVDAAKKDTAATKDTITAKRGLVDALKQLRTEIPAVNFAILAMRNPWVALTAAAVGAMTFISAKITALNQVVAQSRFFQEWQTLETRFNTVKQRSNDMAEAFKNDMDAMKKAAKEAQDQIEESLKTIAENSDWESKALDLDKQKAIGQARLRGAGPTEIAQIEAGFDARQIQLGQRRTIDTQEAKVAGAQKLEAMAAEVEARTKRLGSKDALQRDLDALTGKSATAEASAAEAKAQADLAKANALEAEGPEVEVIPGTGLRIPGTVDKMRLRQAAELRASGELGLEGASVREARINQLKNKLGSITAGEAEAAGLRGQAEGIFTGVAAESARMPGRFRGQSTLFGMGQSVTQLGLDQGRQQGAQDIITGAQNVNDPNLMEAFRTLAASRSNLAGAMKMLIADMKISSTELEFAKREIERVTKANKLNR